MRKLIVIAVFMSICALPQVSAAQPIHRDAHEVVSNPDVVKDAIDTVMEASLLSGSGHSCVFTCSGSGHCLQNGCIKNGNNCTNFRCKGETDSDTCSGTCTKQSVNLQFPGE